MNEYLKQEGVEQQIDIINADAKTGTPEYIKLPDLKDRPIFLNFGGDATDGGSHDIRIKKLLLNTKLQQPKNVNLNRQ